MVRNIGLVSALCIVWGASARMDHQTELGAPTMLVELRCEALTPETSAFAVTLQNLGPTDTAVVLGVTFGNGRVSVLTGIKLRVRRSAQMREDELLYDNPTFVSGRADSWIVPLSAGSSFTFSVPVRHFISSHSHTTDFKRFLAGSGGLDARVLLDATPIQFGEAGVKRLTVWVGTLTSNQVHVPNHCFERSRG